MKRILLGIVLFVAGVSTAYATHEYTTEYHSYTHVGTTAAKGRSYTFTFRGTITDQDPVPHPTTVTVTGGTTTAPPPPTTTTGTTTTTPPPSADVVLPAGFTGVHFPAAGETVTCAAPLRYVTIRVDNPNVTIRDCDITGAAQNRYRPGIIEVYADNLTILRVGLHGDGVQQAQGVYSTLNSGLKVDDLLCDDPGIDPRHDHCMYLNKAPNFVINNLRGTARNGAMIQLYPSGSTGVLRNSVLGKSVWNIISSGSGNSITVENSQFRDATEYALYARVSGIISLSTSYVCGSALAGNQIGKWGVQADDGGTFFDNGGNTYSQYCTS